MKKIHLYFFLILFISNAYSQDLIPGKRMGRITGTSKNTTEFKFEDYLTLPLLVL